MNALYIRASRMHDDILFELLNMEGIDEVMQDSDKKDLQHLQARDAASKKEASEFMSDFVALRAEQRASSKKAAKPPPPPGARPSTPRFFLASPRPSQSRSSRRSCPRRCALVVRPFHGRWRLFWKEGKRSKSAGWDLHGWDGAIRLLFVAAWMRQDYRDKAGFDCPIQGVL